MRITTSNQQGRATVSLEGRFDFSGRLDFKRVRDEVAGHQDIHHLVLDLSGVTAIDSAALGMLLLKDKVDASQQRLYLTRAQGVVREILCVANFDRLFLS